jgi:hypothetical protein
VARVVFLPGGCGDAGVFVSGFPSFFVGRLLGVFWFVIGVVGQVGGVLGDEVGCVGGFDWEVLLLAGVLRGLVGF